MIVRDSENDGGSARFGCCYHPILNRYEMLHSFNKMEDFKLSLS